MPVLDFSDDLGATLRHVLDGRVAPEILKEASFLSPSEGTDADFALILIDDDGSEHRKFACHDAGNTLASMVYLTHYAGNLNPPAVKVAASVLSEHARHQGLDVPDEIEKMASIELLDDSAIVDERRVRYEPPRPKVAQARQPDSVFDKLASVEASWDRMSPLEKRAAAVELAAAKFVHCPNHIYRYSGSQVSEKFASHMRVRRMSARNPEAVAEYERLEKVAHNFSAPQLVEVLYQLDNEAGLRWAGGDAYGEKIADPFLAVYDRVKEAEYSWYHGGENVSESQLRCFVHDGQARDTFTQTFSEGLWLRFQRDPVGTFKSMPEEQKIFVSRMARQLSA